MRGWDFSDRNTDERRGFRGGKHKLRGHKLDFSSVCSYMSPYSKTTDLGPFEISVHQVLVSSPPSIFLPKLFLSVQISSPSYPFSRGSLQIFGRRMVLQLASQWPGRGGSSIIRGNQQLPSCTFTPLRADSRTHRLARA